MTHKSQNKNSYTVTAVIPAYNAGKYIARTIDSVLAQIRPADEIIVVDDGSTDDTADVVSRYGSKVIYIYQENAGASAARNAGIKAAGCEWIAFLDGDDQWLPEHLSMQTQLLQQNPDLVWSTANFNRCLCGFDRQGSDINPAKAEKLLDRKDYFQDYFQAYKAGAGGWTGTMVIKRDTIIEAGLFRQAQPKANDLDMWWKIAYRFPRIGYIAKPSAVYHMQIPNSITQGVFDLEIYRELIDRHLQLAAQRNSSARFEPFAAFLLRRWIRAMLFDARSDDIRQLIAQFDALLPTSYKIFMRLLTTFPKASAAACHTISKIVRKFDLRSRITRPPKIL